MPNDCFSNKRLDDPFIDRITELPKGDWHTFHLAVKKYKELVNFAQKDTGLICPSDVPPFPDPKDYPNEDV